MNIKEEMKKHLERMEEFKTLRVFKKDGVLFGRRVAVIDGKEEEEFEMHDCQIIPYGDNPLPEEGDYPFEDFESAVPAAPLRHPDDQREVKEFSGRIPYWYKPKEEY